MRERGEEREEKEREERGEEREEKREKRERREERERRRRERERRTTVEASPGLSWNVFCVCHKRTVTNKFAGNGRLQLW